MTQIVDASAFGAVLFGETAEALGQRKNTWASLIAPPLLQFEIGNLFWKRIRRFPESADSFVAVLSASLTSTVIGIEPVDSLGVLDLARNHGLTFYDARYVWLAQDRAAELISLDAQLVRAARALGLDAPQPSDGQSGHTTPRSRN